MSGAFTKVAIAVVRSGGRVLVGTRPDDAALGGKDEFPGGKIQPDETPRSCVVRECQEETGLMVIPRHHLVTTSHEYDHGGVELHFWQCELAADLPEHAEPAAPFRWVADGDLAALDFPDANAEVLSLLTSAGD